MRCVGIDPGSRFCGVGVVEERAGRIRHVEHAVIVLDPREHLASRLARLHERLTETLARNRPEAVAIEELIYAKNVRSALVLGEARGVVLLAAAQAKARIASLLPSVVKQAVTGSGRAEKEQVRRMVGVLLGITLVGERADASDALAVAMAGVLRANDSVSPGRAPRRLRRGGAGESPAELLARLQAEARSGRKLRR